MDTVPMHNTAVKMRPLSANTGMEILGVDLREPLSDAAYVEIRRALVETGIIVFRGQNLEPAHHLAFAKRFGPVPAAEFLETVPDFPEIGLIQKQENETRNVGGNWHSDHSFDLAPPLGSVLLARELPTSGGDTMFANMTTAFDTLSDGLKQTLRGLKVVHAKSHAARADPRADRVPDADLQKRFATLTHRETVHPAVRVHPETGREILWINQNYTDRFDGWTYEESRPLLNALIAHATLPENICRFTWEEGSLAFWENRTAMHYALNDYHGQRRIMHRCVVAGEPVA
ncbi:MAG: taurine dioxygenase [Alphaproteobacteria bacterium]|jgi:taurine dioxygenase